MMLRSLRENETGILKDFLYEAIFVPEGMEAPDRSITDLPELALYYRDFGKGKADNCIVAEEDGRVVGAVWTRIMDDYGHVDDETPSFAISLYREYRGRGIGTAMMRRMLELLAEQGYRRASLAVQKANYAVRMYEAVGFRTADENEEEYIMVCELPAPAAGESSWDALSHEEKTHRLFLKQRALLDRFLEKGAISQAQHDRSLHDLMEKMGYRE